MATRCSSSNVLFALNSLSSDGMVRVSEGQHEEFEALVEDYFNYDTSDGSDDASGSDDEMECEYNEQDNGENFYNRQGVLEESFHIEALEVDDVIVTPEVVTPEVATIPYSSPQSQDDTYEMMDSAATTSPGPFTPTDTRIVQSAVEEMTDEKVCREFIEQTCGCKKASGRPCSSQFSLEYYIERRGQGSLMTRNELDLVMLGSIMSSTRVDDDVVHGRHKPVKRQRPRANYMHNGCVVCKVTLGFIFGVGMKHKIDGIRKHYLEEGLTPRVHKNSKLRPHNALSFKDITGIVNFLQNYSEQHAILLPGRIPAYKRDDMKLLPSSNSKKSIWTMYQKSSIEANLRAVQYTTFCTYWRRLLPNIIISKPRTDLCWTCQQNSAAIMRAINRAADEKSQFIKQAEKHLDLVKAERSHYKEVCKASAETLEKLFPNEVPPPGARIPPNTHRVTIHYSFDMAQQVHYPSDPFQPGPIYFLTPRKCAIFGVCCEGVPRQVNYLIDEASNAGKGGNIIISLLHHFLSTHSFGETSAYFHADNCAGQNKNRYLMYYCMWRVAVGLHEDIKISFLPVGHTKFSPDWCFGLVKRKYRKMVIGCLDDIVKAVHQSGSPNVAQLVGTQGGEIIVPMYNWSEFFEEHTIKTALKGITQMHHFHFKSSEPGKVIVKNTINDKERTINLLKVPSWRPSSEDLPDEIIPPGLSSERKQYLYEKIREFVPSEFQDLVCRQPTHDDN